ncbi:coiled-coil domain-containing protein 15 isoform X2 [Hylobates moloch]|uniref:coiled-coil domain-containing protein 15 isoform X2 n=1 Tax=Hylobates moloch TaxID=81572 RepID=UPI0026763550|nr:coiled-coil domain-containing protein 15 isoform X2 [Hylobates moloch]
MLGSMARKKPRNTTRSPLALNPLKSKDVLAVLAERNQAIVPVGAWVEPASPGSSEIPAYTSAYLIEEELKEQLRKKQEALKRFQEQVKYRVNQQIRLRKKQQLQKSYERAQKESSIAMQSSAAHLTSKRTSVFPNNLNVAIGSSRLPSSLMPGDGIEDEENQNELFQQQAQALSQTMKQARHRLASFKTVSKKKGSVFPDDGRKSFPTREKVLSRKPASTGINTGIRGELPIKVHQGLLAAVPYQNYMQNQELDYEESSSLVTDEKGKEDLFGRGQQDQQDILSEDKNKPFSRVQKVKFKNPLFVLMEEEEQKQLHFEGLQDILPAAQDYFPEAQGDLLETQGDLTGIQSVKPDTQAVELKVQVTEAEGQAIEPEGQPFKTETQGIMLKAQSIELEEGSIVLKTQDFLPTKQAFLTKNQDLLLKDHCVLPKDQSILLKYQDQDFLPRDQHVLPKDQDILPKYQDQDFLPKDQDFLSRDQHVLPKDQNILPKCQDQDFLPRDQGYLPKDQNILPICQDWDFLPRDKGYLLEDQNILPICQDRDFLPRDKGYLPKDQNILPKCQDQDFLPRDKAYLPKDQNILPKCQDRDFLPRDQGYLPEDQNILPICQDQDFLPRDQGYLPEDQNVLPICQDRDFLPRDLHVLSNDQNILPKCQDQDFLPKYQKVHFKEPYSDMTDEKGREDFSLADYQCLPPKSQDQDDIRNQQPASFMREERVREELPLDYHQYVIPKIQDQDSPREQNKHIKPPSSFEKWEIARGNTPGVPLAYDGYQSGLSTEFQAPLAFQSGVDKEEDKKERQKQYLRHRRLFMDIEREQVKEQQRQKEQKKKIEKIKKKREQERYAEEQRILRMNFHEDPYSGEKMSAILAQLQLEEIKGAREKQQREKEYLRYVEALRAQIQEKMWLYNITLPPLCCCGPDFWDAHPDTCANNCIFYKNHRAYTRALHSFINSCDVPRGNSTLRVAIHNFASAHRWTLKNL